MFSIREMSIFILLVFIYILLYLVYAACKILSFSTL
jgi:hypothetical protein